MSLVQREEPAPAASNGALKIISYIFLLIIFAVGLAIRLYDLKDPPLDFHSTRQLHSALMARGIFYQYRTDVPDWQRELAVRQWKAEGEIEPPIMENLVGLTYRLVGSDDLWIPRLYSIFFWMVGGIGLYFLARELAGDGALVAFLYFLILPYGAVASRAFQPDPLMVTMIIFAWYAIVRWMRTPTWKWAIAAGLLGGLAIYVKAVAVFFIGGAWLGLLIAQGDYLKTLRNRQIWVMGLLTVLPYGCYHIYGMYITKVLEGQMSLRFFPQLWKDPAFYLRWNGQLASVVGFEWFLVSILGICMLKDKRQRGMLLGVVFGYFVYGMTLSYHISTHDYYQLPFIPLVALGLAVAASVLFRNLRGPQWIALPIVMGVLLYGMTIKAWDTRVTLKRDDYSAEVTFWQKLGKELEGSSVVGLTQDYGYRLAYWGWLSNTNWMSSGDFNLRALSGQEFDMKSLFEEVTAGKDYFLVTMLGELDKQPALKDFLYTYYSIKDQGDDYVIFDLHHPLPTSTPTPAAP